MKKILTNEERHFSIDEVVRREVAKQKRHMKGGISLINWTVPHRLSKYHNPHSNQPNNFYWIKQGEDYYIAIERIYEERLKGVIGKQGYRELPELPNHLR